MSSYLATVARYSKFCSFLIQRIGLVAKLFNCVLLDINTAVPSVYYKITKVKSF